MKAFFSFLFSIALISSLFSQQNVVLYEGSFSGAQTVIHDNWNAKGENAIWNDKISSIKVPQGWKLLLYEHRDYQGDYLQIENNWDASLHHKDWNNRVSSIKIIKSSESYSVLYVTHTRWGGNAGRWERSNDITLASNGIVYWGTARLENVLVKEDLSFSWNRDCGNATNGYAKLTDNGLMGWVQFPGEGKLDFKGEIIKFLPYVSPPVIAKIKLENEESSSTHTSNITFQNLLSGRPVEKGQITLYHSEDYTGESKIIKANWSPNDYPVSYHWGYNVGSIKISPGWAIRVYQFKDFSGDYLELTDNWSVKDNISWKRNVGSIEIVKKGYVLPSGLPLSSGIKLYKRNDFIGESKFIDKDWSPDNYPENYKWGYQVQSIEIHDGWGIQIYQFKNYSGSFIELTGGNWSTKDFPDWKNNVGSIKVVSSPTFQ